MTDLRRMRAVFLGAMLVFSLSAMAVTAADDVTVPATEKKVTLQLDGTPIIDAIDMLFKDSGYKYTIEPGVSGSISFGFKNVGFEQAVKTVAESAGLEYEVSGGRYVFRPARPLQVEVMEPDPSVNPTLETEDDNIVYQEEEIVGITTPWEEGPIYYGHMYPSGYQFPPFFETGGVITYVVPPPFGAVLIAPQTAPGPPQPLPPPHLRSPSLNRMLRQLDAIHSVPGYPFWEPTYSYPSNFVLPSPWYPFYRW